MVFEPNKLFIVLVYAKLPYLIMPDEMCSHENSREPARAFYARSYVYNTFAAPLTTESTGALIVNSYKQTKENEYQKA